MSKIDSKPTTKFSGFSKLQIFGLGLAAIIGIVMLIVMDKPENISQPGWAAIAVMLMMLSIWLTDAITTGTSGFLLILLMIVTNAVSYDKTVSPKSLITNALSGFGDSSVWLVAAAFLLGAGLTDSGIGKRLTYWILSRKFFGKSFDNLILGFSLACVALGPLIPSAAVKTGILLPLGQGILDSMGIKPYAETGKRSNNASSLIINIGWMSLAGGALFITGVSGIPLGVGILRSLTGATVSWMDWTMAVFPACILVILAGWLVLTKMFPAEINSIPGGVTAAKMKYEALGPLSSTEKKISGIFILTLLLWIFETRVNFDTTSTALLSGFLLLMPFIGLGKSDREMLKKVNWDVIILFGASLSLAKAITKTGAGKWLAQFIFGYTGMQDWHAIAIVAFFSGFMFITHLGFASATAHKVTFTPIILVYCDSIGINPTWMLFILMLSSSYGFILHNITLPNMVAFGTGYFPLADMIKSGTVLTIISWIIITLVSVTWLPFVGFPIYK